ncbi:MAG: hypothetical protein V1664_00110 [Candidatus Uhrbacteria bacterium]
MGVQSFQGVAMKIRTVAFLVFLAVLSGFTFGCRHHYTETEKELLNQPVVPVVLPVSTTTMPIPSSARTPTLTCLDMAVRNTNHTCNIGTDRYGLCPILLAEVDPSQEWEVAVTGQVVESSAEGKVLIDGLSITVNGRLCPTRFSYPLDTIFLLPNKAKEAAATTVQKCAAWVEAGCPR